MVGGVHNSISFCFLLLLYLSGSVGDLVKGVSGLACNWGTMATHPLPPKITVKLMKDNGFDKVKLFETDHAALKALGKSGIQVMVGIPNTQLAAFAASVTVAERWVQQNVSAYISKYGTDIRYVAVGNEPFLKDYKDMFTRTTFPALKNVQAALIKAGLGRQVKVTVPFNAGIYESASGVPSGGDFRSDIQTLVVSIIRFLRDNNCPISINVYPFLSLQSDPSFPKDFAFFPNSSKTSSQPVVDGSATYTNVFDANFDTLVAALAKNGFNPNKMQLMVGEVGWPTDGDPNANPNNARKFNQGLFDRIISRKGTPRHSTPPEIYVFSLIDEDNKSLAPGTFERHWGIFNYDGSIKYQLKLGKGKSLVPAKGVKYLERKWCVLSRQANENDPRLIQSVNYACEHADCTSITPGSSCGGLDPRMNASYAFNAYFQTMDQKQDACNFNNLAEITRIDPSQPNCRFQIQINTRASTSGSRGKTPQKSNAFSVAISGFLMLFAYTATNVVLGC